MTTPYRGMLALLRLPQTNGFPGKDRPVLLLRQAGGRFPDWLVCMTSSRLGQAIPGLDEVIDAGDVDFAGTGLKVPSVIRITRLAILHESMLERRIGEVPEERVRRVCRRLADWLMSEQSDHPAAG